MSSFTPSPALPPPDPLALDQPKSLGPLLSGAWRLWSSQPSIFLITAALVVIPINVIVGGVIGHGFYDPYGKPDQGASAFEQFLLVTIGTSLVTAIHARAVVALSQKQTLTTESAFKLGAAVLGPVMLAAIVYFFAIVLGVFAIIVGAFIVAIYGIFTAQIAALEGLGPIESLKASFALVKDNGWWRTLGYQIVLGLVAQIGAFLIALVIAGASSAFGEPSSFGIVAVIALALVNTAVLSWTALVTTLLYFSWKAESRLRASGEFRPRHATVAETGVSFVKPNDPRPGDGTDPQ